MKPDEKYMSETSSKEENKRFNFIPPSFNRSFLINDSTDEDSNNFLDLFPSETNKSELFCYYSSFSDCDKKNLKAINKSTNGSSNFNNANNSSSNNGYSNNSSGNLDSNTGYSNNANGNYNNNAGYPNNSSGNYNNNAGSPNNFTNNSNNYTNGSSNSTPSNNSQNRAPSTFDILRDFDLDLDETTDFQRNEDTNSVNKIFSEIQTKHSGIFDTLNTYNIPSPISNVIVKRLIKLSLLYSEEK